MITFIRSSLFNIIFFLFTLLSCILLSPLLLILPNEKIYKVAMWYVKTVYMLEKSVLGLDYEIRGIEYINRKDTFIVAAKHQALYETFKLHMIFDKPAIILKKELINIPIWGKFLACTKPIAIDRTKKSKSIIQIIDGAKKIKDSSGELPRAIVIFPQGTRVFPEQTTTEKPYKSGVFRVQEATELDIIPMATNSGYYWKHKGWIRRSGTVVFEFLPPIKAGNGKKETMQKIEETIETHSSNLLKEAMRR